MTKLIPIHFIFFYLLTAANFCCAETQEESSSRNKYNYVLAFNSCAPWDGPAVRFSFYAAQTECDSKVQPEFNVFVWRDIISGNEIFLDGRELSSGEQPTGNAYLVHSSSSNPREASPAKIKISSVSDLQIAGEIDLHFGTQVESGKFIAKRCKQIMPCG